MTEHICAQCIYCMNNECHFKPCSRDYVTGEYLWKSCKQVRGDSPNCDWYIPMKCTRDECGKVVHAAKEASKLGLCDDHFYEWISDLKPGQISVEGK